MAKYYVTEDKVTKQKTLTTNLKGYELLKTSFLNKDTAFTLEERKALDLKAKLPDKIETLDQQVERCWLQYQKVENNLHRFVYLDNLHDKNQVLFFKLVSKHIKKMVPVIYTPVIGDAVKEFSNDFFNF